MDESHNENIITILNNKFCKITTEDQGFLKLLIRKFSYRTAGYEYLPAYKNGYWNGFNYLIQKSGNFSLGLLPRVEGFCKDSQWNYQIVDLRKPIEIVEELDILTKLNEQGKPPRYYQLEILNNAINNNRGIIRSCVGSGKTLTSVLMTAKFNKPTIIYVIGLSLMQQFHDLYSSIFDEPIGIVGGGNCDIQRITIASIWSIGSALNIDKKKIISSDEDEDNDDVPVSQTNRDKIMQMLSDARVHILDECHTCTTDTIKEIYKNINPERIYGMSGTPYRGDGSDLLVHSILGEQISNVSASLLINEGFLVQPIIKYVKVPKMRTGSSTYGEVYSEYVVDNDERNNLILQETTKLVNKGYQVLVIFRVIRHGKILYDMFQKNNFNCELVSGKDDLERREEIKKRMLAGELNLVIGSSIYEIGVDIPSLSAIVMAAPSKSIIKNTQIIGRSLRLFPGKTMSAIVDFYDDVKYLKNHSQIRRKIFEAEDGFKVVGYKFEK